MRIFEFNQAHVNAGYTFVSMKKRVAPQILPFLYSTAAKTMLFVVGGGLAHAFYPVFAPPLFMIAGSIVVTRLVIKLAERYHFQPLEKAQVSLAHFRDKHKYIQIAAAIGILAVAIFSWQVACILAIPFGIYAAVVVGLDYYGAAQEVRRRQENRGTFSPENGVLLL